MVNYYAVHVMSGRENKTRDLLLNRAVAQRQWQDTILDIIIPTEKEYVTRRGKRVVADKKVFPGYIFVKMHLDDNTEKLVQGTDGVTGFVRSGSKPVPVAEKEIETILKNLENSQEDSPKSNFKPNDVVSIISGPFADFSGKIESIDESKGKIKAYVNIFGRDTLVELAIKDVKPIK